MIESSDCGEQKIYSGNDFVTCVSLEKEKITEADASCCLQQCKPASETFRINRRFHTDQSPLLCSPCSYILGVHMLIKLLLTIYSNFELLIYIKVEIRCNQMD